MNFREIKIKNDIYLAYWLKTLKPLFGKKTYDRLLSENVWVEDFFGRPIEPEYEWLKESGTGRSPIKSGMTQVKLGMTRLPPFFALQASKGYGGQARTTTQSVAGAASKNGMIKELGHAFEMVLRRYQKSHAITKRDMLQDPSGTVISDTMLKFHDRDKRGGITFAFDSKVKELIGRSAF